MADRITKKDLYAQVDHLNERYCKDTKHRFKVEEAYGGYKVVLTGKRRKDGKGYRGYLRSGYVNVTDGYQSARSTLKDLNTQTYSGGAKKKLSYYENKKDTWL